MAKRYIFLLKLFFYIFFSFIYYSIFSQTRVHVVLPGDDIYKLARKYKVRTKQIADINGFSKVNTTLHKFQTVIIPNKYYEINSKKDRGVEEVIHIVKPDENLYSISRIYDITVYDILASNPDLKRGVPLEPNKELLIFSTKTNKSQLSQQYIILNSEALNKREDAKVILNNKLISNDEKTVIVSKNALKLILDTLELPESDRTEVSRLLHYMITNYNDKSYEMDADLQTLSSILFYNNSIFRPDSKRSDHRFKTQVFGLLKKMTRMFPNDYRVFALRGMVYYWVGDYKQSITMATESLAIKKDNYIAKMTLGASFLAKGDYENSKFYFESAIDSSNITSQIAYNLAEVNLAILDVHTAIDYYKKAYDIQVIQPEIDYKLGKLYKIDQNIEKACMHYYRAKQKKHFQAINEYNRNCKNRNRYIEKQKNTISDSTSDNSSILED